MNKARFVRLHTETNKTNKKFIYCAPLVAIDKAHLYRPYFEIPRAMLKLGYSSLLLVGKVNFTYEGEVRVKETGVVSRKQLSGILVIFQILKLILMEKPDIVFLFQINIFQPLIMLLSRIISRGSRFVIKLDWDGTAFPDIANSLLSLRSLFISLLSFLSDFIVTETSCGVQNLQSIPLIRSGKIKLVPNTFSDTLFKVSRYEDQMRESVILFVGRIHPEKGLGVLFNAFSMVSRSFPDWKIEVIGKIEDDEYFDSLDSKYSDLIKSGKISFTGDLYETQLRGRYLKSSIFCLPSYYESFGIARFEAMACGVPVVTSTAGCGSPLADYGSLVFPVGNSNQLAANLTRLMESETLRKKISEMQIRGLRTYEKIIGSFVDSIRL
jgi:glycosyltransferase involved in cell wall biosynthesis